MLCSLTALKLPYICPVVYTKTTNWPEAHVHKFRFVFTETYNTMTDVLYKILCIYLYFVNNNYNKLQYTVYVYQYCYFFSSNCHLFLKYLIDHIGAQYSHWQSSSGLIDRILSWCVWFPSYSMSIRVNPVSWNPSIYNNVLLFMSSKYRFCYGISLVRALTSLLLAWIDLRWRFGSTNFPILIGK